MRQWKIAISLAVVGAVAAPFVFGTWESQPMSHVLVPLTAKEKESIITYLKTDKDCNVGEFFLPPEWLTPPEDWVAYPECRQALDRLKRGGTFQSYLAIPEYLAINLAAALSAFVGIFGLAFLVPALIRRSWMLICWYWRWLSS